MTVGYGHLDSYLVAIEPNLSSRSLVIPLNVLHFILSWLHLAALHPLTLLAQLFLISLSDFIFQIDMNDIIV